jgi:uncharacterized protein (TIGR01777 family)
LVDSRVVPTRTLVDAMESMPESTRPSVLVSASGTDLYEGKDEQPADEETVPAETFLARLCLAWEREAHRAERLGTRVVVLRFSLVIAPGAPSLGRLVLPFRFFVGGPIGSGRQWFSWIGMEDAVRLVLWAIDDPALSGPVNVSSPYPCRQIDLAREIGRVLRRPSRFRTFAWLVRLVLGEQAILPLGSRRVWPARALAHGKTFQQESLAEALESALRPRA